ncbi:hypothetical protein QU593_10120 [Rossellomorea marisflavi]|uniref:hypothetical protein n=1 Tax=Rossellomorea marisflavi TaxID=189381 RepID=UPI0025B1D2B0|nr:hypothetical protein [Rossellomorea marisflavi]WJV20760.1 hypothetical protein QU593_10120 [Rossellomorea marisflavi]
MQKIDYNSYTEILLANLREVAAECGKDIPDSLEKQVREGMRILERRGVYERTSFN